MAGFLNALKFQLRTRSGGRYLYTARGIRPEDWCLLCFFAGLVGGTVMANLWYPSLSGEAGYYISLMDTNINLGKEERVQLFGQVIKQRMVEVWIAWLAGLTAYAVPLFCLFTAGIGFSVGAVLSVITVQKGLIGLPVFLMTVMPQAICYIPLWCILLLWGMEKGRRFRIPAFVLLLFLSAAGSACEAWINPFFLKLLIR